MVDAGTYNLDILGNFSISSTGTSGFSTALGGNGGTISIGGTATIGASSDAGISYIGPDLAAYNAAYLGVPETYVFGGNVVFNINGSVDEEFASAIFNSSSAQTVGAFNPYAAFANITIGSALSLAGGTTGHYLGLFPPQSQASSSNLTIAPGASLTLPSGFGLNVEGGNTLTLGNGATLFVNGATNPAQYGTVGGSNFPRFGACNLTAGTVSYGATASQTIYNPTYQSGFAAPYGNLIIANSGGAVATASSGEDQFGHILGLTLTGNLTINSGATFAGSSYSHSVAGNWTNNGTFTAGTSTVTFNGAAQQTMAGATNFYSLTMNNSATGSTGGLSLSNNATVTNVLTLTSGEISTGSSILLVSNTAATGVSGGSTNSFVNGPLNWALPANLTKNTNIYNFPIGSGSTYLPYSADSLTTGATGPTLQVQAFAASAGGTGDGITLATTGSLSTTEYWSSTLLSGSYTNASISLTRQAALNGLNVIGTSSTKTGTYTSLGGTVSGTSINKSNNTKGSTPQFYVMAETPVISISSGLSPTSETTTYGTASAFMTLSVSGAAMLSGITVTPPTGFVVCLTSGGIYASSVVVGAAGTIASTPVYIELSAADAAGSYSGNITLSATGATNVTAAISTSTVNTATLTINPTPGQSKVYGTNDPSGGFTYSYTGLVAGDNISGMLGRAAGENVNSYAYNIGSLTVSNAGNYTINLTAGTFAITRASITPDGNQSKVYGTNDPSGGFTLSNTGLVNGVAPEYWNSSGNLVAAGAINDVLSGNLGRASGENVNTYAYNIGSLAVSNAGNYTVNLTASTFAITQASLTITRGVGQRKTYGTNDPAGGFTYTSAGVVSGVTPTYWNSSGSLVADGSTINDVVSGHMGRTAGENIHTYNYNIGSVAAGDPSNYITTLTVGTFTILPASLAIVPTTSQSKVYGTNDPSGGFTYSNTGLVSGVTPTYWNSSGNLVADGTITDVVSGKLGRAAGENVNTYAYSIGSVAVGDPSNYTTGLTAGTFAITTATLTIAPTPGQSKVYGTNDPSGGFSYSNTGSVSGVTPTYWNSSGSLVADGTINDVLSISGKLGRAAGENVNTYAYNIGSVTVSGTSNYTTGLTAGTFSITKASLAIAPTAGQSKAYGTNDPTGGFTYGNTGLVSGITPTYWNSSGSLVADGTITDVLNGKLGRAAGESVGSYAYNLGSLAAGSPANYTAGLNAGTFAITTATLTITPTTSQSKVYGTNDPSGGFTYSNTGLVSGVTPTYWNSSGSLVADGTITDVLNGKLGRAAGENTGTYAYNLGSVAAGSPSNYTAGLNAGTFAITTATLTITPTTSQSKVYGTNDPSGGFTYSNTGSVSGVTPTYWNSSGSLVADGTINDVLSISGKLGRAAGENVNTYAYNIGSVTVSGTSNYTTGLTAGTFAITTATLSINPTASQSKVYGSNDPSGGFTYSNTGSVSGVTPTYWNSSGSLVADGTINDVLSISGKLGRAAGENVNTYAYNIGSVTVSGTSNYTTGLTAGTFSITKASLAIAPTAGQSKAYGTNDPTGGFTYGNTGLVSGITPTYWNSSGSLVADGSAINDVVSGKVGRVAGENVTTYAYNLGTLAVSAPSNYTTSLTAGTFAITPASLTFTPATGKSKVYGTNDPTIGFIYSRTGLVSGVIPFYWNSSGSFVGDGSIINDVESGNLGRAPGENAGMYAYNLGSKAASDPSNYTTTVTAATFAITTAAFTITPTAGQSKVYGTNDPSSGFTYGSTGLVSGVAPTYWNSSGSLVADGTINDAQNGKLGRTAGEIAGAYAYNLGSVAVSNPSNYTTSVDPVTFAITAATLTIAPKAGQSKVFGTNDPSSGFTYGSTGLVSGVTPTYWNSSGSLVADGTINDVQNGKLGRTAGEIAGAYAYNLGNTAAGGPSNYTTILIAGTFAITQASLTIIPTTGQSKIYGTNEPPGGFLYGSTGLVTGVTPTYWNSSGNFVGDGSAINDAFSGRLGRTAGENVGAYEYSLGGLSVEDPSNYKTGFTGGFFVINAASLTITANNITKCTGATYTFTGTEFTTAGLVPGDSVSNINNFVTAGAAASAAAGTYSITLSVAIGIGLRNYNITFDTGSLKVETLALTITQVNPDCYSDPGSLSGSVTGGTAPYMYTVNSGLNYDPTAIVFGPSAIPLYSPVAPGYYAYSVTDSAGCMAIAARLSVNPLTQTAVLLGAAPAPPVTQVCYGSTKTITTIPIGGAAPYTYSLNANGVSGPFVASASRYFNVPAGTYYITVKDNIGCTYTTNTISITQPSAGISFTTSIGGQACVTLGGITVTATGGYGGYSYCDGYSDDGVISYQPGNVFSGLGYNSYTVTVKDQDGCAATPAVVKFTPLTTSAIIASNNPICPGGSTSINTVPSGGTPPYSYRLDGSAYVPSNSRYFNVTAGEHFITVKDNVSCTYTPAPITINTVSCTSGLAAGGAEEVMQKTALPLMFAAHVSPNPAQSTFHLQMQSSSREDVELIVTNMLGVKVYEGKGGIGDAYEFGSGFTGGMYILQVRQGNEVHTVKLVKGN